MWNLIHIFFGDLLDALLNEYLTAFQEIVGNLFRSALMIETLPGLDQTVLSTSVVRNILYVMYGFMLLLLVLKLLWKGFNVYVLWRDGEAETSPGEMVLGAVFAMLVAVAFPLLYEIAVDVVMSISSSVFGVIGITGIGSDDGSWLAGVISRIGETGNQGSAFVLLTVVYLIILLILICKLLVQGAELLVWRLGVPFAVIGLVNSDGGVWKSYAQTFFKMLFTILVQYFCIILGTHLIGSMTLFGLVLGIAFEIVAFSAPKLLAQFMAPAGGGGGMQKAYTLTMIARAFIR